MALTVDFMEQYLKAHPVKASEEQSNGQKPKRKTRQKRWDMEGFLKEYKCEYLPGEKEANGSIKYTLLKCSLCGHEGDRKTAVFVDTEGKPGFHCFHGDCAGKTWHDFREHLEPGYDQQQARESVSLQ